MQDAWDVVAVVDADELAAERVAVAVLKEYLFAGVLRLGTEVHSHIFAIECQRRQRHALYILMVAHLDGWRVGDNL